MTLLRPLILANLLVAGIIPGTAVAHRDYEKVVGGTRDARGRPLTIALHYTDGIMATDPVKLVVYDSAGAIVAETPYFRDVLLFENAAGETYAFAQDIASVLFRRAWRIDEGQLVPAEWSRSYCYATMAAIHTHWMGYLSSLALIVGGTWLGFVPGKYVRRVGEIAFGCGSFWLVLVFMHGRLSLTLVALTAMILTAPCWLQSVRRSRWFSRLRG